MIARLRSLLPGASARAELAELRALHREALDSLDEREAEVARLRADRDALRSAVRELREAVDVRDHALWTVAVVLARDGVVLPAPGAVEPETVIELAAHLRGRVAS